MVCRVRQDSTFREMNADKDRDVTRLIKSIFNGIFPALSYSAWFFLSEIGLHFGNGISKVDKQTNQLFAEAVSY